MTRSRSGSGVAVGGGREPPQRWSAERGWAGLSACGEGLQFAVGTRSMSVIPAGPAEAATPRRRVQWPSVTSVVSAETEQPVDGQGSPLLAAGSHLLGLRLAQYGLVFLANVIASRSLGTVGR